MLLNTAGREWTVATLTTSLRGSVPPDFVRITLDALLTHEFTRRIAGQHGTTVRLTDEGATALAYILDHWRRGQEQAVNPIRARGTAPVPRNSRSTDDPSAQP
jgi:hypothetical protein